MCHQVQIYDVYPSNDNTVALLQRHGGALPVVIQSD